jgi:hypothetical protein
MSKQLKRCQRLRELEEAIAAQRKRLARLNAKGFGLAQERERFAELLKLLDQELHSSGLVRKA